MPSAALQPLESALERQTAAGLALLERAGPDAATRPAAGGWSVLECLDHLNKTAEASRALGWRQDGLLADYYDHEPLTGIAKDAIDIMGSEVKAVERHAIRLASRKGGDRGHQ